MNLYPYNYYDRWLEGHYQRQYKNLNEIEYLNIKLDITSINQSTTMYQKSEVFDQAILMILQAAHHHSHFAIIPITEDLVDFYNTYIQETLAKIEAK